MGQCLEGSWKQDQGVTLCSKESIATPPPFSTPLDSLPWPGSYSKTSPLSDTEMRLKMGRRRVPLQVPLVGSISKTGDSEPLRLPELL